MNWYAMYSPREKYINSNIVRGLPVITFLNIASTTPLMSPPNTSAKSLSTKPMRTCIGLVRKSPKVKFKAVNILSKDEQMVATHSTIRS